MNALDIEGMVLALCPQVNDPDMARLILQQYWKDRIAFVWTVHNVHMAANERGRAISCEEARTILHAFHKFDRFTSVNWFKLLEVFDESGFGRKLTKAELNRFLKTNLVVVAKS